MQTVQAIDSRRAQKEKFSTCWDFAFEIMTELLYFSVSSKSVRNHNCRTYLPCAFMGNFPISLVTLAMLSEIYYELGQVSVNNRLNFATLLIINISLRLLKTLWQRHVEKESHPREAGVEYTPGPSRSAQHSMRVCPSIVTITIHSIWYYYVWHNPPAILLGECSFLLLWNNLVLAFNQDV